MGMKVKGTMLLMMAVIALVPSPASAIIELPQGFAAREIPIVREGNNEAALRLASILLQRAGALNSRLGCIPKANRCGPEMDGVPCCEPYTCTSTNYGICS